jgi:predicted phage terminase large subunit-like protein
VKQRFLVEGRKAGRVFVPARLTDNPGLDQEQYLLSLAELDPVTRQQLLEGDWDAKPGGAMFDRASFEIVDHAPPPQTYSVVRYWDTASTKPTEQNPDPDWTVGVKMGRNRRTGEIYILDVRRDRRDPGGVDRLVNETADEDGRRVRIVFEQEPGSAGKQMIFEWQRKLPEYAVKGRRVDTNKVARAQPLASRVGSGLVKLVRGEWITEFLDEAEEFPFGDHDDQVDAASGAYAELASGDAGGRPVETETESLTSDLLEKEW